MLTVQTNRRHLAPKETITHHFSVSGIARRNQYNTNLWRGAENVVKIENLVNIRVTWIAWFYYFRHLYSAGKRVYCSIIAWVAHRYGQLYLHCSLIYFWVPSSCFYSDQPLSEAAESPAVSASRGRLHYPRRRRWWLHALTDRLLDATDDDQRQHHHAEHHFQL